jgi:hypothetical protein
MRYRAKFSLIPALALCVVLASGCTRGDGRDLSGYKFQPVKGRVLQGDRPLSSGTITFFPVHDPNFGAVGEIQPDGTFELTTRMLGKTEPGAPEGMYRVEVTPPPTGPEGFVTIKPGENDLTIRLGPAPK